MKGLAAMSGGVDSSVMAAILADEGNDLVGITMRLIDDDVLRAMGTTHDPMAKEAADAAAACARLGIPHRMEECTEVFRSCVVEPFSRSYLEGQTPNPCIQCNRYLKIAALQQLRRQLGLDFVATGHYARTRFDEATGRWQLLRAADSSKDQSYVLYHLSQDDLEHLRLPLGGLTKECVRTYASELGLPNAGKPDSQDICFVPDGDYTAFIERYASCAREPLNLGAMEPGAIVNSDGQRLGTHKGVARYTIGQRKGLGVAAAEPLFVCAKDATRNVLTVGPASAAQGTRVVAHDANLVSIGTLDGPMRVTAKTHYRQVPQLATATLADGVLTVEFDEPQRLAAPGQSLVIYDGDVLLGGGTIA